VSNSVPVTLWMLLHILLDHDLASRVGAEVESALGAYALDIDNSMRLLLLNSIYYWTLRL
jgi:hypothetical protein